MTRVVAGPRELTIDVRSRTLQRLKVRKVARRVRDCGDMPPQHYSNGTLFRCRLG